MSIAKMARRGRPLRAAAFAFAALAATAPAASRAFAQMDAGAAAVTPGLAAPRWTVFADEFGTAVDVPENVFPVDAGPSFRGTGRDLQSGDGRARLMIYMEDNDGRHTPASFVRANLAAPRDRLDYNRVTHRFFAISGVNDDQIFYSRCNFPHGVAGRLHCVYLAYPKAEVRRWDAIVTRISRSLRPAG
jgi:hypothetical protein